MQLSRSLLAVTIMGSFLSVSTSSQADNPLLTDNVKYVLAGAAALGAGYIYQRAVSNAANKGVLTSALDAGTTYSHKAVDFVNKWAPTAAVAGLAGWLAYHNKNVPNTYLVNHIKNLALATK